MGFIESTDETLYVLTAFESRVLKVFDDVMSLVSRAGDRL